MEVNFHGNVINLKEKMLEYEKRKSSVKTTESTSEQGKDIVPQKVNNKFEDIATVKRENLLAAGMKIESREEAYDLLENLKNKFNDDFTSALKAHSKINPNKVMKFYPFD